MDVVDEAAVTGPVSIAAGNLAGDARAEIVAPAPTYSGAEVKIVDAVSGETRNVVYPYGGVSVSSLAVALGDVDGNGALDVILSAVTPGGTEVQAIDASGTELAEFYVLRDCPTSARPPG